MTDQIIDAWIQHPTPQFIRHRAFESLRRWMRLTTIPESIPSAMTLGALKAAKVDLALVSAWWGPAGPLISNDQVAALVNEAPDRLRGVASVDLHRPMEGIAELRRCVKELGFIAVRQLPWLWDLPPDDRRYYPLYAECCELGIPFCTQVGHAGPLAPSEPGRPIPYLDHVALEFPELVIVGGHVGYPWTDEMVAMARKYPNVYIDTSAYKLSRLPEALTTYMHSRSGQKKVLFGSNWPMVSPADSLKGLDALGLSADGRADFLSGNATRVFNLNA